MKKLIFLLYLIPAIFISGFFLMYNQVEILVNVDQGNVELYYNNQSQVCASFQCKLLVPRNLKNINYKKENIVPGILKIDTYKDREYSIKTNKIAFLRETKTYGTQEEPFIVRKEGEKFVLFSNFESPFPLASFPSFKVSPSIFYSENLNYILLREDKSNSYYLFDTKNNKKTQIQSLESQGEIKVLNNGDLLYMNTDGLLNQVDKNNQIINYYNLESIDHFLEIDQGFLILTKDMAGVLTDKDGINFAYELSKSVFINQAEENYKIYLFKNKADYSKVLDVNSKSGPFRLISFPKVNNKIYLESLDGLFEIEL